MAIPTADAEFSSVEMLEGLRPISARKGGKPEQHHDVCGKHGGGVNIRPQTQEGQI